MLTLIRAIALLNAPLLIVVTLLGRVILVRLKQEANASSPITVTGKVFGDCVVSK